MTVFDITKILPSKAKAWVGLIGSLLTAVVPFLLSVVGTVAPQYSAIVLGVLGFLTFLGVYHAPYAPEGTVLVPAPKPATPQVWAESVPPVVGQHTNPWLQKK